MREIFKYGSMGGALGDRRIYPEIIPIAYSSRYSNDIFTVAIVKNIFRLGFLPPVDVQDVASKFSPLNWATVPAGSLDIGVTGKVDGACRYE